MLAVLSNERDHHTIMALVKKAILPADIPDSTDIGLLTSYACHYVSKQFAFRKNVALIATDKDGLYTASSSEGT